MTTRNPLADLAAVVHPVPAGHPLEPDIWSAVVDDVEQVRQAAIQNWEAALDAEAEVDDEGTLYDPVLSEIAAARREVIEAEQRLRLLLAYAREFVAPRPYTLADLARSAGMSISGVRTSYGQDEIREVARRIGARVRPVVAGAAEQ
jgi:hypothetical protein